MSLPIYQRVAVTDAGDIIPGAEYTVINEITGLAQAIYSDRTGLTLKSAPYFADSAGVIQFYIAAGVTYRVSASGGVGSYTDRYVYSVYAQETDTDTTAGRVMTVGAFGLGAASIAVLGDYDNVLTNANYQATTTQAVAIGYNLPDLGIGGAFDVHFNVVVTGTSTRTTQKATEVYGQDGSRKGRSFSRVRHDAVWSEWSEAITANSAGNVGINKPIPSTALDVAGTVTADGLVVDGTATVTGNFGIGQAPSSFSGWKVLEIKGGTAGAMINFEDSASNRVHVIASQDDKLRIQSLVAEPITLETNNIERVRIDSSGNFGIGTSSPQAKLHIMDSLGSPQIKIDNQGTSTNIASLLFQSGGAGNPTSIIQSGGTASGNQGIIFKHGNNGAETERMRIDSSGNVGINTASPEAILHVVGDGVAQLRFDNIGPSTNSALRISRDDTSVSSGNPLGYLEFGGNDATSGADASFAHIGAEASGTHSAGNNPTDLIFGTTANGTSTVVERVRIDSSGNLGIGANIINSRLSVGSLDSDAVITSGGTNNNLTIKAMGADGILKFGAGGVANGTPGTERVRIDSSGNLLVGTTSISPQEGSHGFVVRENGYTIVSVDNARPMLINRATSDGDLLQFRKDGSTVGNIGTNTGFLYIAGHLNVGLKFLASRIRPVNSDGSDRDGAIDMGASSARFQDIYATNANINTSDRNEKQDILEITAAETAVATACKGLLRSFRWKDAVAEKGDDARIHFGIIAQDLQDAFTAEGLDSGRYGMFISSTWWETQTEVAAVEAVVGVEFVQAVEASEALYNEDGELVSEAVEAVEGVEVVEAVEAKDAYTRTDTFDTLAEAPASATERTRLGVRYSELLAFIIAAI